MIRVMNENEIFIIVTSRQCKLDNLAGLLRQAGWDSEIVNNNVQKLTHEHTMILLAPSPINGCNPTDNERAEIINEYIDNICNGITGDFTRYRLIHSSDLYRNRTLGENIDSTNRICTFHNNRRNGSIIFPTNMENYVNNLRQLFHLNGIQ